MLKHFQRKLGVIIVVSVGLISGMITILLNWSFVCTVYSKLIHNTYLLMIKPISTLIVIFGLFALNLLLLTLYLRCILKKQNVQYPIVETNHSVFKPDKNMVSVLLLLKGGIQLYRQQIKSKLEFSHDLSEHCIGKLDTFGYICVVHPDDLFAQINTPYDDLKLELSEHGREYLIENNLL